MTAWARSPRYGSIVLGPTQEAVYRYVISMTEGDRRPEVTLARIAVAVGKPISSVHDALGRLRALGLIGCAARMGRSGGHRLWRIATAVGGPLDVARHRRAVARIVRRWYSGSSSAVIGAPKAVRDGDTLPSSATLFDDAPVQRRDRPDAAADSPHRDASGRSFRELMGDSGFTPWWRESEEQRGASDGDSDLSGNGRSDDRGRVELPRP